MIPTTDRGERGPVSENELLSQQILELSEMFRELSEFAGPAPQMEGIVFHCLVRVWHLGERHGRERIMRRAAGTAAN